MTMRSFGIESGTNCGIVHTDASYCSTNGRKNSNTCGFASVRSMWQRQIHFVLSGRDAVTARVVADRRRLRVVDHDEVPLALELQRVVEHAFEVDVLHVRRPLDVGALQRVVDGLGHREELVAAVDHVPFRIYSHVAQQCNMRGEQLGDAAAVRGRVEVQHPGAPQRLGQGPDPLEGSGFDDVGVVVEMLVEQRHAFEQLGLPGATRTADRRQSMRCDRALPDRASSVPTSSEERSGPTRSRARWPSGVRAGGIRRGDRAAARRRRRGNARHVARRARRIASHDARDRTARRSGRRGVGCADRRHRDRRDGAGERARARARSQRSVAREHARNRRVDRGRARAGFQSRRRRGRRERDDRRRPRRGRGAGLVAAGNEGHGRVRRRDRVRRGRERLRTAEGRERRAGRVARRAGCRCSPISTGRAPVST